MRALPTDRAGWLVLLAAVADLTVHSAVLMLVVTHKTVMLPIIWPILVLTMLPPLGVVLAAWLARGSRSPLRYLIATAGLLAAVGEAGVLDPWAGGPVSAVAGRSQVVFARRWLADPPMSYTLAVAALAVAVGVGWRSRSAAPHPDGPEHP